MENGDGNLNKRPIRVWVDGCFDLAHFGHANALRQAKALGDQLIVGIHSDAEITKHKGPPVFHEQERYRLIKAIKWVDEVVENAPYYTYLETLKKYSCDFCVHGDDLVVSADGTDPYQEVKNAGCYKEVKRTEGISTTALVSRMLKRIQQLDASGSNAEQPGYSQTEGVIRKSRSLDSVVMSEDESTVFGKNSNASKQHLCSTTTTSKPDRGSDPNSFGMSIWSSGGMSYMPNILRISQFCEDRFSEPKPGDVVVYVPGTFDLFHIGHLSFLEKCLELGNYLLIGLHSDQSSSIENGRLGSIMTMQERLLSVLACRYVRNVVIDAPYVIPAALLDHFKVNYVAIGWDKKLTPTCEGLNPMKVCEERGILRRIDSGSKVTTAMVISRILQNRLLYEERNKRKEEKEILMFQQQQQQATNHQV